MLPKYLAPKKSSKANVWFKSIVSLALYLLLGYYIFPSYAILLLVTAIVIIHEMGHFLAMKAYRYNELGIFFLPLLGAYVSGTKQEVSQKQSAVIILAGPLPGIIIGILFIMIGNNDPNLQLFGDRSMPFDLVGLLFLLLNLINLLPIYPLDGGQLLNRVFLDEESWIGKGFVILSAAFLVWVAWKLNFWILLIFPVMMLLRMQGDRQFEEVEKRIEDEGIDLDIPYEELSDENYWRVRNILIESHPAFRDIPPSPPYEYHEKEEKIMSAIQSLLHRRLIQDVSIAGKILIILLWVLAFASPWLLDLNFTNWME